MSRQIDEQAIVLLLPFTPLNSLLLPKMSKLKTCETKITNYTKTISPYGNVTLPL